MRFVLSLKPFFFLVVCSLCSCAKCGLYGLDDPALVPVVGNQNVCSAPTRTRESSLPHRKVLEDELIFVLVPHHFWGSLV
jgi:hypothetical protein